METTIKIGWLTAADIDQVAELIHTVISQSPHYNDAAKRSELAKFTQQKLKIMIAKAPNSILIAKVGQQCIGFQIQRDDEGTVWGVWCGVHPDWRNRGVAQALVNRLICETQSRGIHKIWCDCRTANNASRHILKKAGFSELCTLINHWHGQDYILLEKML